jgi:hypothetical protein
VGGIVRKRHDTPPRVVGQAFHHGLELWRNKAAPTHAIHEARRHLTETLKQTTSKEQDIAVEAARLDAYLTGYFKRYQSDLNQNWGASELRIESPGEIGFIDMVFLDYQGKAWVLDDKTAAQTSPHTEAALRLDDQLLSYCCLLEDYGYHEIGGVIYRQTIKTRLKPRMVKGKRENIDQYYDRVMLDYQKPDKYLQFTLTYSREEIAAYRREKDALNEDCREVMQFSRELTDVPRNSASCIGKFGACDYLPICSGTMPDASKMFRCTSRNSLDGDRIRNRFNVRSDNDQSATDPDRLRQNDTDNAGIVPGPSV